jgi:hypothetical protein
MYNFNSKRTALNDNGTFTMKQTCRYAQGATGPNFGLKSC